MSFPVRTVVRSACLAATLWLALPGPATAQLTAIGATPTLNATDLNAVAFDEVNGVYLHVGSTGRLRGRFVNGAGVTVGPQFDISNGLAGSSYASWMGVAYSSGSNAGVFLVAYASEINANQCKNVYGQLVRFNGSGGELVGGAFPLSSVPVLGTCRGNPAAVPQEVSGIAFNPINNQFLVVWSDGRGGWDVYGRLVNVDGSLPGAEINLTAHPAYQGQPTVAHDWRTNTFLVAYIADVTPTAVGTMARVLNSSAQPITAPVTLNAGGYQDLPSALFLPEPGRFLVLWRETPSGTTTDVMGRQIGPDGALAGNVYPVIQTNVFDGLPDGRYNWNSRNTLITAQHDSGYVVGALLDAFGNFQARWTPLSTVAPSARGGSFRPHVAVGAAGQFGVSYVLDLAVGYLERFQASPTATPGPIYGGAPPTDDEVKPDPTTFDLGGVPHGSEFFAEGVASNDAFAFNTYYLIQNDNDVDADVRAYFSKQSQDDVPVLKERLFKVKARSRKTIDLKMKLGPGAWSAVFQSMTPGAPVTTQQSVYWGPNLEGSSTEAGARQPSTQWFFAEGTRGGNDFFTNFFQLFNPNPYPITVVGEYFGDGASQPSYRGYTVPAFGRSTILANAEVPELAGKDFSTRFFTENGATFVAQRAMYWGPGFVGGHTANGAMAPHARWMFAEGAAAPNFDTYFTLLNPNGFEVKVNVRYLSEVFGPMPLNDPVTVKPYSRHTIWANGDLGNVGAFGATFETVGGHGIVVERSIYWGKGGFPNWVEGTNDVGVNAPAMTWMLPEGSDSDTFDTFVLVANPNTFPVNVAVTFYLEGGGRYSVPATQVKAGGRLTIDMNAPRMALPGMTTQDAVDLAGKSYAIKVESLTPNGPVLVEEAIYRNWDPSNYWRAGSSAFGAPR